MEVAAACGDSGVGNPHHYTETLYSRYEHGLKPIHIINRGESEKLYVVEDESKTRSFTSDRSLLMYLHDGYDPRITFDRYFRIGDHSNNQSPEVSGVEHRGSQSAKTCWIGLKQKLNWGLQKQLVL